MTMAFNCYFYELMQLQLKNIQVSPEQINRNQVIRKKEIVDGWKYQLDENDKHMRTYSNECWCLLPFSYIASKFVSIENFFNQCHINIATRCI